MFGGLDVSKNKLERILGEFFQAAGENTTMNIRFVFSGGFEPKRACQNRVFNLMTENVNPVTRQNKFN